MNRHPHGRGSGPEFTLSSDSAREMVHRTGPPRTRETFLSTDHLSTEAAAAYVDGRLPHAGQARADSHLARCPHCRREVEDQREARRALRGSGPIQMPSDLLERLRSLEDASDPATRTDADPPARHGEPHVLVRLLRRLRRRGN